MSPVILLQGLLFAAIGILLLLFDNGKEVIVDYTDCEPKGNKFKENGTFKPYICIIPIALSENLEGDVKFQYGLENFYQNNRLYIKSRNDIQLTGDLRSTEDCHPYDKTDDGVVIAPCGQVANSMFNDTFELSYNGTSGPEPVPFSRENVIWPVERKRKYKNPRYDKSKNETLCGAFKDTAPPKDWKQPVCLLGNEQDGFAFENIDFIVWMKPAALPKFRKNYRSLNRTDSFSTGLQKGNYTLTVHYNYPILQVSGAKGKKRFIIAVDGLSGPKNKFLSIAFISFGSFCVLVALLFLVVQFKQRVNHCD